MTRLLLSLIVMLPLLVDTSVPCPEPDYPSVTDCPFAVDPNLIQGKLLGWAQVEVGQQLAHTRTWCDPDGDPARAEIIAGPDDARLINKPKIKSYTIL